MHESVVFPRRSGGLTPGASCVTACSAACWTRTGHHWAGPRAAGFGQDHAVEPGRGGGRRAVAPGTAPAPRTTMSPPWSGTWRRPSAWRWPTGLSECGGQAGSVGALVCRWRAPGSARADWWSTICTRSPAARPKTRSSDSCSLRPRAIGVLLGSRRPPGDEHPRLRVSGELCQLDQRRPAVPLLGGRGALPGGLRPSRCRRSRRPR